MKPRALGHGYSVGGRRPDLENAYFRSSWEANYARYLNLLIGQGDVISWLYEPDRFEFPIKRGTRTYTPDFRVEFAGRREYHEVKGWMDQKSRTRIKRFRKYYPDETLLVIGAGWFKQANKTLGYVIPNWERPVRARLAH